MFGLIFWLFLFFICLFVLIKFSDKLVDSAKEFGFLIGVPTIIIGILFLSIGTTAPELTTGIISTIGGVSEIGVSTAIGTMIVNILLLIVLIGLLTKEHNLKIDTRRNTTILAFMSLLFVFFIIDLKYTFIEGLISVILLVIYVFYLYLSREKIIDSENKLGLTKKQINSKILLNFTTMVVCFIILYFSSKYLIQSIIQISDILHITKSFISITVVAIGTSLPELFVAISAIKKREIELTIGNIIGANTINALGVVGISSLIGNIIITRTIIFAIPFLLISTILFVIVLNKKKITWMHGVFAIIIYVAFIIGLLYL